MSKVSTGCNLENCNTFSLIIFCTGALSIARYIIRKTNLLYALECLLVN